MSLRDQISHPFLNLHRRPQNFSSRIEPNQRVFRWRHSSQSSKNTSSTVGYIKQHDNLWELLSYQTHKRALFQKLPFTARWQQHSNSSGKVILQSNSVKDPGSILALISIQISDTGQVGNPNKWNCPEYQHNGWWRTGSSATDLSMPCWHFKLLVRSTHVQSGVLRSYLTWESL